MPYINTIDINGVVYNLENLTDGNNIVTLPELSKDDIFVLRGNIVNNTSSTSTTQPLSAKQGKLLRDDLNSEIQNRINDVNLEEQRATAAEQVLRDKLNQEITDRKADVDAEEARATNAENTLTTSLNTEITRAEKAEADELARAQAAEQVLTDNLAKEVTDRTNDVNAEEARALAAEKVLTDNLSDEVTRATNRENEISTALTNEVSRATGAENTLTSRLDTEISRAKAAESANSTAISTEKSRAEGIENGLKSRIETMEAFFKAADIDASKDFIDTLKEIQSYIASDKTGAAAMTASINANKTAIENEASRAKDEERDLADGLDAEIRDRIDAIRDLDVKKVDKIDGMGLSTHDFNDGYRDMVDDSFEKLKNIDDGANNYIHPTHDTHQFGLYKITVDASGHVSKADSVSKEDLVKLGLPADDTTYGLATHDTDGLLSAEDKQKYDEYDERISAIVGTFVEPVDCIVEQGTSGSWTYRKWNSGIAECWGTVTGTLAPSTAESGLTGLKVFSGSVAFPTGLFVGAPSVTYNCRIGDGYSFPADAETSTTTHFNWTALSTAGTGYSDCAIVAKASGVWK